MSDYITVILAFVSGGMLCAAAQLLIDLTRLSPARILVFYVSLGVLLFALGVFNPLYSVFGSGVSTPIIGFGAAIGRGVKEAVESDGLIGALTGGLSSTSAGISAALICALSFSFITKGKGKRL